MNKTQPAIGSYEDPDSCIVMCTLHKFSGIKGQTLTSETYAPIPKRQGVYIALGPEVHWPTSYLLQTADPLRGIKKGEANFSHHYYQGLSVDHRTEFVAHIPLVVAGKRYITIPTTHAHLPYSGGWRECYVEWLPLDGGEFKPGAQIATGSHTTIYEAKHAAGTLYMCTAVFDKEGQHRGFETTIVIMEISWWLGPPDNLKVDLYGHTYPHNNEAEEGFRLPDLFYRIHYSWVDTYYRARTGFMNTCSSFPQIIAEQRQQHITLYQPEAGQAELFTEQLRTKDWRSGLDSAVLPWQLILVVRTFSPPEFATCRTVYKRAKRMIETYAREQPEKAAAIQELWEQAKTQLTD